MSILGIEFNDHALTGISGDQLVFAEPGAALLEAQGPVYGAVARDAARGRPSVYYDRYWRDLSEQKLSRPHPAVESYADLAFGQLQHLWSQYQAGVSAAVGAVPDYWDNNQLALLLGIAQEAGMPLAALATIPVAATRRHYPGYELIHIDIGAHATTLTMMEQGDGSTSAREHELISDLGAASLERSCADYFARRFLECSRFDPMHDAQSEQQVYDRLPDWLAALMREPETELHFEYKGNDFSARVSLAELEDRLRRRFEPVTQRLRSRLDVAKPTAVQMNSLVALFPGVAEALADLPGCDVFVLEAGAAARGLASRSDGVKPTAGAITLTEALPWDQPPADVDRERAMASSSGGTPSHAVLGGKAYRLDAKPLRIGAEASAGDYNLVIAARHAGVSRRHCSIEQSNGQVVLNDHSRYGTRLNGHKVEGSAVLQPGDVVSIGDPACELLLIAEIVAPGSNQGR